MSRPLAAQLADTFEADNRWRPITKTQLAKYLGVSPRTVDNYVSTRKIPYIKIGRTIRFRLAAVEKALERYTVKEISL